MDLDENLTVADIAGFNIRYLDFLCTSDEEMETALAVVTETTKKASNAFEILMSHGREFPKRKTRRLDIKNCIPVLHI